VGSHNSGSTDDESRKGSGMTNCQYNALLLCPIKLYVYVNVWCHYWE